VRRAFLVAGVFVVALTLSGCETNKTKTAKKAEPVPPSQHFHSRPDLRPPIVRIRTPATRTAPGYVFLAPKMVVAQAGPMIMDNRGELVWFHPLKLTKGVTDFRVQRYQGRPVLTWWRGRVSNVGVGNGWYVIYDDAYQPVAEVRPGNGLVGDVHEFMITSRDTALMTIYHRKVVDLTAIGGPKDGRIWDGIVQEVEIPTGRVLFEWHSYPDIGVEESYSRPPRKQLGTKPFPYDYIHLNSIDVEPKGHLLISGRNTHALYEISRRTGKVLWRLGGKKSDFEGGAGTTFAWQHDARRQRDGTITLFDNGAAPRVEKFSRVLVLRVDVKKKHATLVRSYRHPKRLLAPFEGNAQFLPNGHVFVGWGAWPYVSELDVQGRVLFDAYFGQGKPPGQDADSYRAYRFVWRGRPTDRPAVAVSRSARDRVTVYASWNGATDIARWLVLAGPDEEHLRAAGSFAKTGFETPMRLTASDKIFAVRALRRDGTAIATSEAVEAKS
jgi:Arylsulfotransferase (ASST)